eukprot:Sspe_Gene.79572::Locus_49927_Transcript_1_1_Confidence_1.000_Length_1587::g.79572::m.79572
MLHRAVLRLHRGAAVGAGALQPSAWCHTPPAPARRIQWGKQRKKKPKASRSQRTTGTPWMDLDEHPEAPPETASVDDKIEYLVGDLDEALPAHSILEELSADGAKLADRHVSRLVLHTITLAYHNYNHLTMAMFDCVCSEARAVLESARRLGHEVGGESLATMVVILANPSDGMSRDLEAALEMLEGCKDEIRRDSGGCLPVWLVEALLKACAIDDDEESARKLLKVVESEDGTDVLTPAAWAAAMSACDTMAAAKEVMQRMIDAGVAPVTEHYNALLKGTTKCKLPKAVQPILDEMETAGVPKDADTYLAWMATLCVTGDGPGATKVYHRMLTESSNFPITWETLCAVLRLCLLSCKTKDDVYCRLAKEVWDGAVELGVDQHQGLLTRAMWVFSKVGDVAMAKSIMHRAEQAGVGVEGHHWELLRAAEQADGNVYGPLLMKKEKLDSMRYSYELIDSTHPQGPDLVPPKIRDGWYPRNTHANMHGRAPWD